MTADELGQLAIAMKRAEVAVRAWMEQEVPRLVYADQAPMWRTYEDAKQTFHRALNDYTRDALTPPTPPSETGQS